METSSLFDKIHRDAQDDLDVMAGQELGTMTTRPSSRPSLKTNFSYPRPDGQSTRHEPSVSRSSLTSNGSHGSVPCMTDASDSEASTDDDYHYNTSASELWDTFWPEAGDKAHSRHKSQASTKSRNGDYFTIDYSFSRPEDLDDDTVTITQPEEESVDPKSTQWPLPKASSPRRASKNPATYSVYPKPTAVPSCVPSLPPRSSSLTPETSVLNNRWRLRGSKSIGNLKSSRPNANLHLAPPVPSPTIAPAHARSLPVSPAGPPPSLRSSVSACHLRETSVCNVTAPLAPKAPASIVGCNKPVRPCPQRLVSVFDFDDSDNESESAGGNGFAKRFARGLQTKKSSRELGHKKSASEKRSGDERKLSAVSVGADSTEGSPTRKRGGSLGRMLGLMTK